MSAAISPFLNLPVGHSHIKRRASDDQPDIRKRQKLDAPATSNQVDDWVSRSIDDFPKMLDSNSPVKKRWTDTVDQAKAIDSIKRALVQITSSYKKENVDPSHTTDLSQSIKSRGVLTTQQSRSYQSENNSTARLSAESDSTTVPPLIYSQPNCENTSPVQYNNNCYSTYQPVPTHAGGVFKHEKQQYQYQPYPSPPRTDTDMMYSNVPYPNTWSQGARQYQAPTQPLSLAQHLNTWNHQNPINIDECMSPSEQTYISNPNSPNVPLTPPDDMPEMKPKIFTNLSDYNLQINIAKHGSEAASQPPAVQPELQMFHPMDVFCTVPGRLSLLSGASKYNVTIGEVQRRLTYPESLNVSLLGGVLRRAKAKNGNHALRTQLEEQGISIPTGRRKAASVSLFTSLLEGESAQLANDFNTLCEKFFPCRELAKAAVINDSHRYHLPQEDHIRRVMNTKQMVADLQELMEMNVVKNNDVMNTQGVSGHNMVPCPQLMTFELLTHGFGASALSAALNVVQTYLDEMMKCMTQ